MMDVARTVGCAVLLCLLVTGVAATIPALAPAQAQEAAPGDTARADTVPGDTVPGDTVVPAGAPAGEAVYGACPDRPEAPSDAPGVAWGDTLAAADRLAGELATDALADLPADSLLRRGDRAFSAGHHTTAFAAYAGAVRAGGGYGSFWKAARAAVDVGQDLQGDEAEAWYGVAEAYGRRAVEARPGAPEGRLHLAQALGLVALDAGTRERVQLSEEIRREARAAIEADSAYAGGWHVLGRWHRGVMELSGAGRFFARTFLGGEVLGEASWEDAARHLERAAELEPDRIVHHLELGRVYRERDRPAEAVERWRRVLELPPRDFHDCVYQREARELLETMDAEPEGDGPGAGPADDRPGAGSPSGGAGLAVGR